MIKIRVPRGLTSGHLTIVGGSDARQDRKEVRSFDDLLDSWVQKVMDMDRVVSGRKGIEVTVSQ